MQKQNNNRSGQTILELIVAITVLVVALVATIVLIVTSIRASRESRNRLIASNLAREAIEIVRNIRDSNWLDPQIATVWDSGLTDAVMVPRIDPPAPTALVASPAGFDDPNARVWFEDNTYTQGVGAEGQPMEFYRVVYLNSICRNSAGEEEIADPGNSDLCGAGAYSGYPTKIGIRALVEIRWPKSDSHTAEVLEDRLYNWQVI